MFLGYRNTRSDRFNLATSFDIEIRKKQYLCDKKSVCLERIVRFLTVIVMQMLFCLVAC